MASVLDSPVRCSAGRAWRTLESNQTTPGAQASQVPGAGPQGSGEYRLPSLTTEQVAGGRWPLVDLRSPGEFAEDHLPGAYSHPLFDDTERALVGTVYNKASPDEAYARGLEITARKVSALTDGIALDMGFEVDSAEVLACMRRIAGDGKQALEGRLCIEPTDGATLPQGAFVLHCWRGGLRSQSVCALLRELGQPAYLLEGGYKAYRRSVLNALGQLQFPRAYVLRGLTGVGKTLVLREIERLAPGATIDLEDLAQHRSSILGAAGLEPVSQRAFESRLLERHRQGYPHDFVFYEGESRKIGNAIQPELVWESLKQGVDLRLSATLARRVEVLSEDYLERSNSRDFLEQQLPFLEQRLGTDKFRGVLVGHLRENRISELVELLLERYYDPLYKHSEPDHRVAREFNADDPTRCAEELLAFVNKSQLPVG